MVNFNPTFLVQAKYYWQTNEVERLLELEFGLQSSGISP